MVYDITERLKFNEDPVLIIKGKKFTIRSDAEVVLQLMGILTDKGEFAGATEAMKLLLSAEDHKKLSSLHLKVEDYVAVMKAAVDLAIGEDPGEEFKGE